MNYRKSTLVKVNKSCGAFKQRTMRPSRFLRTAENFLGGMGILLDTSGFITSQQINNTVKPIRVRTVSETWDRIGKSLGASIFIETQNQSRNNQQKLRCIVSEHKKRYREKQLKYLEQLKKNIE